MSVVCARKQHGKRIRQPTFKGEPLTLRRDSEKLGVFLGEWNRKTQTDSCTHCLSHYSQLQMVTSAKLGKLEK